MIKNFSVLQKFLLLAVVPIVLYASVILFWVVPYVDHEVQAIEENNAKAVLDKIALLVEKTGDDLSRYQAEALQRHMNELKSVTDVVYSMSMQAYHEANTSEKSLQRKKNELLELIKAMRYNQTDYLFAIDYNNTMLAHPYILTGTPMQEVYDIKGEPIVPKIVSVARRYGEGFTRYWWKRNTDDDTPYEKLTYSKDLPAWHMVIGTGVYLNDIRREVQRRKDELMARLHRIMQETKIGKSGYIYVFDDDRMIIHPNSNINGKNFKKLPNPGKGTYIYDDLVKAAHTTGKLYYKWDKPSDKGHYVYDKISWIRYVPSMQLYVVSSAYVDDLNAVSSQLRREIIGLTGIVLFLSLLWTALYVRKLFRPIRTLTDTASVIAQGHYDRRITVQSRDEIGALGNYFNAMVDTLEEHINHLDDLVRQKTEQIRLLAVTDALTGLYNRRYLSQTANKMFIQAQDEAEPLSVMMLDIDHFKRINDTYGHDIGDNAIQTLADTIKQTIRKTDTAYRYGGEEFVVLLQHTSLRDAKALAERLRRTIDQLRISLSGDSLLSFTVSIGVAQVDHTRDRTIEDTLRCADIALYEAKCNGRNRTEVWDERISPSS